MKPSSLKKITLLRINAFQGSAPLEVGKGAGIKTNGYIAEGGITRTRPGRFESPLVSCS
jgi:hypothetical protein